MALDRASVMGVSEFRGRVGVARCDITPPLSIYARTWGSAQHDVADGLHCPLVATCCWFSPSEGPDLVLLTLDAIALWQEEADAIRAEMLRALQLEPAQLLVHPSHAHSTPMLARRHADRPGGEHIAPYLDSLPAVCSSLAREARNARVPSVVNWAYGSCGLAVSRDAVDAATGRGVCGPNPAGAADHTLLVGRVVREDGRVSGVLVNYACHPVSLGGANRLISPDYIGPLRQLIESHGVETCVFLHGASGNMTPRRSYQADVEAAVHNGRELGFAVLSCLESMPPPGMQYEYAGIEESGTALAAWQLRSTSRATTDTGARVVPVSLPLKSLPPRLEIVERLRGATERFAIERAERLLAIKDRIGDATSAEFPVTIWALGDAIVVATTGEPYVQFQQRLRAEFPQVPIAVLNLTNGTTNYLPDLQAFAGDNYPSRYTEYAPGCLERVQEETARSIRELRAAGNFGAV